MEVHVDLAQVRANAETVREEAPGEVIGVTKGVDAQRGIVEAFVDAGIDTLAVSQPAHLQRFASLDVDTVMLRVPSVRELPEVVASADLTLHGSIDVIEEAAALARRQGLTHRIVPMVDAGDGREGIPARRFDGALATMADLDGIDVAAIGINVGCFGERPDLAGLQEFIAGLPARPLSVGGSVLLPHRDALPATVHSFRVGDAILTGQWLGESIAGLASGAFELHATVLRSGDGESLIDIGSVTTDPPALSPAGEYAIDRWSTEQAVIDRARPPGETVVFEMTYPAIARSFGWQHVEPVVHG